MRTRTFSNLSDSALLRYLAAVVARDCTTTAEMLALIAEVDARKLYLPAGFPSMRAYCVYELHMSEDAASKRIQAMRAAREFPAIFTAVAEGRLHLTAVCLLAPHLTRENAEELLASAAYQTKPKIQQLLAQRFPRSEMLALVQPIPASTSVPSDRLVPTRVESQAAIVGKATHEHAPAHVEVVTPRSKVKPHAPERFALQLVIAQATYDKLQHAQALLSHALPSGDIADVLDRALDALIAKLEKVKFAATTKPRPRSSRSSANPRYIPAHVKRAVRERDGDQCTFVSETGRRCSARKFLQYDHVDPVARGGQATVESVRLLCRAHNQYEAERMFGAGFMNEKRKEARRAAAEKRTYAMAAESEARAQAAEAEARAAIVAKEHAKDIMAGLRQLGFRVDEARRAAEFSETIPITTLEERMRAALRFLGPKPRFHGRVGTTRGMPAEENGVGDQGVVRS